MPITIAKNRKSYNYNAIIIHVPRMRPSSPPVTKVGVNRPTGKGKVTLNSVAINLYTAKRPSWCKVVVEKDSVPKRYFNITKDPWPKQIRKKEKSEIIMKERNQ